MTTQEALQQLKDGNQRYVEGNREQPHLDAEWRKKTALEGQNPFACVLTCSDSRVPIEHVFDAGVGDLFEIQVAGNVCGVIETASVEFAVWELNVPLVVVVGHTKCGGVTTAVKDLPVVGPLKELVDRIKPAVGQARKQAGSPGNESEMIDLATRKNVFQSIADMVNDSSVVHDALRDDKIQIHGGVYDIETGIVEWIGQHPQQAEWSA